MLELQENDHFSTKDFDEALDYAQKSTDFEKAQLLFKDLKVTDNGELTLQGTKFKISEGGFKNLCSTLKIPWTYANMVPNDQLIFDVNRLAKERELDRLDTYFKPETETIIDMNDNSKLTNISNFAFINKIKHGSRFMFTNHWLKMEIIPENGLEVQSVGDIHKVGSSILHYPTSSSITQAFMELWTLRCTNGAIAPRSIGREKLNLKSRNDVNNLLETFIDKVKKMVLSKEDLENAFKYLDETMIEFQQLKKIDKRFSRIIGDDTPLLMGSAIYNEYAMIDEKSIEDEERLLTHSKYDLYYNITNYGSNITKDAGISRKVQTFAGNLLFNALEEAE